MTRSDPPRLATFLIDLCGVPHALTGDLIERYHSGFSRSWFWRQAIVAIIVTAARDIRVHTLLALRAVPLGWAASYALAKIYWMAISPLFSRSNERLTSVYTWLLSLLTLSTRDRVVYALYQAATQSCSKSGPSLRVPAT